MTHTSYADPSVRLNENSSKKRDFVYTLRPIYIFSRIFGAMPFSLVHNSIGEIQKARVNIFDFLWFMVSIAVRNWNKNLESIQKIMLCLYSVDS